MRSEAVTECVPATVVRFRPDGQRFHAEAKATYRHKSRQRDEGASTCVLSFPRGAGKVAIRTERTGGRCF